MLDSLRRTLGFYDSNGLRYSIAHLNTVDHRQLLQKPMEYMERYVDVITKQMVDDCLPMRNYDMSMMRKNYPLNTTAIGNAAYVALYHHNPITRGVAFNLLSDYGTWLDLQQ